MIPYARQSIDDADVQAVVDVLRSDFLTQGPAVARFENDVASYTGARHAVSTSNATAALHVAVAALGVGPGDLVWTSPNSFVASANCARYCGADVDFVDIDPRTYTISPASLEEKLGRARAAGRLPKVLVAVDFAGQPCDLEAIAALRERYGFSIVEDASHAVGATFRDSRVGDGTYADITVFSFHPVKIITTGEGGVATTQNDGLAASMRLLRSHGVTRDTSAFMRGDRDPWEYEQVALGYNYRLSDVHAALGSAQLARIGSFLERRRAIAARYDRELDGLPVVTPYQHPDGRSAYHLYPIVLHEDAPMSRRALYDRLRERGVAPNVHYIPIHTQPYYEVLGFRRGDFPIAEAYYDRALSLPMFVSLTDDEQGRVIAELREALGS